MVHDWPKNAAMKKKGTLLLFLITGCVLPLFSQNNYPILPKPSRLEERQGQFLLSANPIIAVAGTDPALRRLVETFAQQIGRVSGRDTKVFAGNFRIKDGINFVVLKDPKLGKSGYFLEVTPQRIVITAEQMNGFIGGLESLKKLMPTAIFSTEKVEGVLWRIPCCYIEDQPDF